MTESPVDVAAIKDRHEGTHECLPFHWSGAGCMTYRLAEALDRAQAASEGVDMLIAQAERRGAVKALRKFSEVFDDAMAEREAMAIENGADL